MTTASPEREWGTGVCCVIVCGPLARVAEWQTRQLQVLVSERAWGFKSPLAHNSAGSPPWRSIASFALILPSLRKIDIYEELTSTEALPAAI